MNLMKAPFVRKIVPVSIIAAFLFCTPLQLTAQERESRPATKLPAITWLTTLWSDLTTWLVGEVPSHPPVPDDACSIDPWGGCRGHGS